MAKIQFHKSGDRGSSELGWLHSRFSFSFAEYYDPKKMGFGKLRVLNDDVIEPGKGFGAHPHRDMEIITIPTFGRLAHKDSTGGEGLVGPGEVQVMSAGTGVVHSEYNHSQTEQARLFQIWIETAKRGAKPRYEQKKFQLKAGELNLVVSGREEDAGRGALHIHQDARIYLSKFEKHGELKLEAEKGKGLFFFVIEGEANVDGEGLANRDAAAITGPALAHAKMVAGAEIMLIEVPV